MANWQHCPAVERRPAEASGAWVFKGTGVPLYVLYETLATDATVDEFAERFGVSVQLAAAALQYEADELHDYRLDYQGPVPYARNTHTENAVPDDAIWRNCSLVEQATGRLGGVWVFEHTRLALYVLYYHLAGGATLDEFVEWYLGVEKKQAMAVLKHAAESLHGKWLIYADSV